MHHSSQAAPNVDPYDTQFCRQMVEDSWRAFLRFAAEGSQALGVACIQRLDDRAGEIAAGLAEPRRTEFLRDVEAERGGLFDEYTRDPVLLKRRLGVSIDTAPPTMHLQGSGRSSLFDVAARTAVRATVWETVAAFFRAFR